MIFFLISIMCLPVLAQTSFKPLIDKSELQKQSMARTLFIRAFETGEKEPIRATGVILKDGFLLTNEHVMRTFLQNKKVSYHIFTNGRIFHRFQDVFLLGCDAENDLCLLRTKRSYKDYYFTLDHPSFRKISQDSPLGLFRQEKIFFNGFCSGFPKMSEIQYVDYVTNGYLRSSLASRKKDTPSLQFSARNGDAIACGGDSGGPLFDENLYLYGLVRDFENDTNDPKKARNYAIPMNIIKRLFNQLKDIQMTEKNKIHTIDEFPNPN